MIPTSGTVPFAQSDASQEVAPPYFFPDVTVHGFVIDVDLAQVQAYCDSRFNLGTQETRGFVYKATAAWPYALLLYIQYPQMICAPSFRENMGSIVSYGYRGVVSQTEVFLAIPVVRYGTTPRSRILDSALEWALPFIVVGNPMSASCGREMLGMEKLLADVEIGRGIAPGAFSATLTLPGWKTGAAGELQEPLTFMQVESKPPMPTWWGGSPDLNSPYSLLETRAGGGLVDGLAELVAFGARASLGTLPLEMRTISMKQFRDAADPDLAIYQSLVSCRSRYSKVEDFRVFNEQNVSINFMNYASFKPILEVFISDSDLEGSHVAITPRAAYSLRATVNFDAMRTIYTAPMDPGPAISPAPPGKDLLATWARPWVGLSRGRVE